jgi:hypothetical protein
MRIPKTSLLALVLVLFSAQINAQLKLPFTNNDLRTSLQKVVADFPKELSSIKGEVVAEDPQTVQYASLLKFQGAEENTITKYNSSKPIYSWQAVLLTTEDFEDAAKKYKWLCNQLKVMTLNLGNNYTFSLSGKYEAPDENKKFSSSIFQLTPAAIHLPKLKIEADMQFYFPEWKVNLLVYQKEREDNERGDVEDNGRKP